LPLRHRREQASSLAKPAGARVASRSTLARSLCVALFAAAVLLALAPGALAVVKHLKSGRAVSYQPLRVARTSHVFDFVFKNLDYNGGPVMSSNTNYAVYWDPEGGPAYPSEYQVGVNQYFEDLAHDSGGHENVDSVTTQYNDAAGEFASYDSHFGGALIDKDPYPKGCSAAPICVTDAQLQKELEKFIEKEKVALGLVTDLAHEYFILTPPGVESCLEPGVCSAGSSEPFYCAYHGNVPLAGGGEIIYSNDPYVTGIGGCDDGDHPNNRASDGVIEGGLTHEHNESITDPEPNNAWTDYASGESSGFEVGDKCNTGKAATEFGAPLGEVVVAGKKFKFNQVINGHKYWYQQEWSNQGRQCLQRFTFSGSEPVASYTATVGATPEQITFNAAHSSATGGVQDYSWQFNAFVFEGVNFPNVPEETSSPSIGPFLFEPGNFNVALTVFAPDGTSIGTARTISVGGPGPTAKFSLTTAAPTAGQPVGFDASASSDPGIGNKIASYLWSFGDGTEGSGEQPSHTYAANGVFSVSLTVTGSDGLSRVETKAVSVGTQPPSEGGSGGGGGGVTVATPTITTPTITQTPPAAVIAATGQVSLLATSIGAKKSGSSAVKLSCTGNASCVGRVTLIVKVRGKNKHLKSVMIGAGTFTIHAGAKATVTVKLSRAGRSMLRGAHGRLSAIASILKSSPSPASTQRRSVRLVQVKK
jgi:PKD repeat protein